MYPARLAELARILRGIPWMVAGGMTIPLRLGAFYRAHADVDIVFPIEAFPDVANAMQRSGYYLSRKFPLTLFGRVGFHLSVPARHDGWLVGRRPRKLRFIDTGGRRAPNLLSEIEPLPYRIENGEFASCDGRYRFRLVRPLAGHTYTTPDGDVISCLDLYYVTAIKRRIDGAKHALDVSMVARHFPGDVSPEGE